MEALRILSPLRKESFLHAARFITPYRADHSAFLCIEAISNTAQCEINYRNDKAYVRIQTAREGRHKDNIKFLLED